MSSKYTSPSLETLASRYDFLLMDTCALLCAFRRGEKEIFHMGEKGINVIRNYIERGVKCFVTEGIIGECVDDSYWSQLYSRSLGRERRYNLSDLMKVFEEKELVLNLQPKDLPFYEEVSSCLHNFVDYENLGPIDVDLFLSALFLSKEEGKSALLISNDFKIAKLWREFMGEGKLDPRRFGFAFRIGLDVFDELC